MGFGHHGRTHPSAAPECPDLGVRMQRAMLESVASEGARRVRLPPPVGSVRARSRCVRDSTARAEQRLAHSVEKASGTSVVGSPRLDFFFPPRVYDRTRECILNIYLV